MRITLWTNNALLNEMTAIDLVNTLRKPWKWTPLFYASYLIAIVVATVGWVSPLAWIAMELFAG